MPSRHVRRVRRTIGAASEETVVVIGIDVMHLHNPVPTANPNPLTPIANRLILAPDERSLRIDLVRLDRTVQVAGCVGSRDPGRSTPTQRAAAQIPEAIGVRQY